MWLPTLYIGKLESGNRRGDGPSVFLRVRMVAEVQFPIMLGMALYAFSSRGAEVLSITRWLALNT